MGGENSRPEAKAGIVADFDSGEAEVDRLAEEVGAVGGAVGVPAGGEGQSGGRHTRSVSRKEGSERRDFFGRGTVELGDGVGMRRWQNLGQDVKALTDQKFGGG